MLNFHENDLKLKKKEPNGGKRKIQLHQVDYIKKKKKMYN